MKALAEYSISKKFGKIMRLNYDDGSKVYLNKKGLVITVLKSKFKKEWDKKHKDFCIFFTPEELTILIKALDNCEDQWKKFRDDEAKNTK